MSKADRKPIYLDIRIPLITVRIVLVSTVLSFISLGILFPSAFLAFNYLYNQLIPTPTIDLPLNDYVLNYDFENAPPFVAIGSCLDPLYANQPDRKESHQELFKTFDFNLHYDFNLNLDAYCKDNRRSNYEPIMYKISIVSNQLIGQLSPYGVKPYIPKRFNLWPITNNIHQLENPQVLVSSMNTIMLDCDNARVEKYDKGMLKIGDLFSPVLSSWFIPPFINNYNTLAVKSREPMYKIPLFKDLKFNSYLNSLNARFFADDEFTILLEFNKHSVVIDPANSEIVINISWKGLRYYLFNYRILSYIGGVSTLWLSSTFVLVSTVGLVGWFDAAGRTPDDDFEPEVDNDDYFNESPRNGFVKDEYAVKEQFVKPESTDRAIPPSETEPLG
jgi:hypothetical protein